MKPVFQLIYSDYRRYRATGGKREGSFWSVLLLSQGFWASSVYRFAHSIHNIRNSSIRYLLFIFIVIIQKWVEILTGISLPPECEIGEGLYLAHFGTTIINSLSKVGKNCNLSQGVTLGVVRRGPRMGEPMIGDRVYIGPNAIVIGNISVGNDAAIGAGAVVLKSVPPRGVVVGNPAQLISRRGSFEYIHYDNMETDPERIQSLAERDAELSPTSES